jgi:enterochelin esterase-like enzyme
MAPDLRTNGPQVDSTGVTFRLADAHHRLASVRLVHEIRLSSSQAEFDYRDGQWVLRVPRPLVNRMEYLFEIADPNGDRQTILDRANDLRVPGAFGEKSVIEFPGYQRPPWVDRPPLGWSTTTLNVASRKIGSVHAEVWQHGMLSPPERAVLLIVHDGPEYARLAALIRYAAAAVAADWIPSLCVALLAPGDRNLWYAANPAYAHALAEDVLPELRERVPARSCVGVGASLGALAWLHAHRTARGIVDALFLQSGSFFHPALDHQERHFSRFREITDFVLDLRRAAHDPAPVPVVMTCGLVEENLDNNRHMAATLRRLGYQTKLHEVRDAHNYTAWRDALDPFLTALIVRHRADER